MAIRSKLGQADFESTTSSSQLAWYPCWCHLPCWGPSSRRKTSSQARTCQGAQGWGSTCSWTAQFPEEISEKQTMRKQTNVRLGRKENLINQEQYIIAESMTKYVCLGPMILLPFHHITPFPRITDFQCTIIVNTEGVWSNPTQTTG